ncbi:MAG: FlgD immunoglobulin-like domain containing protein [Bacteroidota bacterium]|jgi:predicted CXXCH cytochrome family protein
MKQSTTVFLVGLLIFAVTGTAMATVPTARIVIRAASTGLIASHPSEFNAISDGLPNVGRGSRVWLEAAALEGTVPSTLHYDTLTGATWRVISAPAHSVATIRATDTANGLKGFTAMFVPDSLGQYQIGLTVTTLNGTSAEVTEYINSANYVGVGTIIGNSPTAPECGACHNGNVVADKVTPWQGTAHATMFSNSIDGKNGAYMSFCISCHTTGYNATPTAVNNGFDDRATAYGWHFPDTIKAGNWDYMKANYPEVAKLANIQCEDCHGPGSLHLGAMNKNQIAVSWSSEMCGHCHDAPPHHTKNEQWNMTAHAISTEEGVDIEAMNRAPCAQCHTSQGFVDVTIDGNTDAAPYTNVQPVGCIGCHDPHDASHPAQLRRASLADACTGCHLTRISSRGLHSNTQGPMLAGASAIPYNGQGGIAGGIDNWSGWQLAGYMYPNSAHSSITDKCVTCHMATVPADSLVGKLGDHSFKVAYDQDSTHTIFNTNGCVCHGTGGVAPVTQTYVEQSQAKINALLDTLATLLPQKSGVVRSHNDTSYHAWTPLKIAGAYNYYFVNNDGSFGVHNHNYATALLTSSIEQLRLVAGAATIASIKDVPNDQGKQVQIVWNIFPTEQSSIDPVTQYGVWRQDALSSSNVSTVKFHSFREMLSKGTVGSRYAVNGYVWTYVGYVPAAKQSMYSFVAPTLFDSTISAGMKWTYFYVTGLTNNGVVYSTMPDSGYSVDNLAPAPPSGIGARIIANTVHLGWRISLDQDFKYFAVYRGTSPDFNPHGTSPLATTSDTSYVDQNVSAGATYYYKLSAFDFSGNESQYSPALTVVVLGVGENNGAPREYALAQNYPNPFNPWTEIRYQLPEVAHVKITVYNTLGVQVATLVDRNEEVGYYTVTWDGNDNRGNVVASGIYLYKMEAGSYSVAKKMIFMK